MDNFMGRYKRYMKSGKWYIRIFYHFLDMSLTNSWLLNKKMHSKKHRGCKLLNQALFRAGHTLCNMKSVAENLGLPSINFEKEIENKRKRGPMKHIPPNMIESIEDIYRNNTAIARINGQLTNGIPISNGIRQGESLNPLPFNIIMDEIIKILRKGIGYRMGNKEIQILCYAHDAMMWPRMKMTFRDSCIFSIPLQKMHVDFSREHKVYEYLKGISKM